MAVARQTIAALLTFVKSNKIAQEHRAVACLSRKKKKNTCISLRVMKWENNE